MVDLRSALKAGLARFLGAASPDFLTLTTNTTHGLNTIASGLPWREGDRVLLNRMEFPANIYPFLNLERFGVGVDWAESVDGRLPLETVAAKVTPATRLVSISFVQFLNGYKADLAALGAFCRGRGIWLVVDGIQGLGAVPFDLAETPVDALAAGGAKWLMWPMGTGFLYLSPKMLDAVQPAHAGWLGVQDAWNFRDYELKFLDTAERFEGGTLNWMGLSLARQRTGSWPWAAKPSGPGCGTSQTASSTACNRWAWRSSRPWSPRRAPASSPSGCPDRRPSWPSSPPPASSYPCAKASSASRPIAGILTKTSTAPWRR